MRKSSTLWFPKLCLILALLLSAEVSSAFFDKDLWPEWQLTNPLSQSHISFQKWQDFLNRFVSTNDEGINLVDYARMTPADKEFLQNCINELAHLPIEQYNRSEQLAYWINLYNALTVLIIAKYYPISSVEEINISPSLFSIGPWNAKLINVRKIPLSLDDIQNRIIRPIWNDNRVHYTLNNGSIGAPNLNKRAYIGSELEQQLNHAAFEYVNSLRGVQVIEGKLIVSKIFEWYNEDFGGSKTNIILHLEQFAHDPLKKQLKHINTIDNYFYNWHLNSTVAHSP